MTDSERQVLEQLSRSSREPAGHVAHAKGLLAVTAGKTYTEAAAAAGRKTGDTVARWVSEFNRQGLAALERKHGGGPARQVWAYGARTHLDGSAAAADAGAGWHRDVVVAVIMPNPAPGTGWPAPVSEDTIRTVLLEAGFTWQQARSWCQTGQVVRKRQSGPVTVVDPDAEAKKS